MPATPPFFECGATATAVDLDVVDAGIDRHNRAQPALGDVTPLSVLARASGAGVLGGAVGRTWGSCCELQQLWVDDGWRRRGLGTGLMDRFEAAAQARGCTLVYLDTFSFQAPAFYRRRGYRIALETRGYTAGVVKYTMHKRLAAPSDSLP